jgi:hypothetical protein
MVKNANLLSGFGLCVDSRDWSLKYVHPGTVADRLGMAAGSSIVKFNGVPVAKRSVASFLRDMGGADELSLAVLRTSNGKVTGFNVVMKVADIHHTAEALAAGGGVSKGASMLGNMSLSAMRESQQGGAKADARPAAGADAADAAKDPPPDDAAQVSTACNGSGRKESREGGNEDAQGSEGVYQGAVGVENPAGGGGSCGAGAIRGGAGHSAGRELVIDTWGVDDAGEMSIEDKIEELGVRGMDGMVAAVDSIKASLVKGSSLNLPGALALSSIGGAVGRGRGGTVGTAASANGGTVSWPSPLEAQAAQFAPATLASGAAAPAGGVDAGVGGGGAGDAAPLVVKPVKGKSKVAKSAKKAAASVPSVPIGASGQIEGGSGAALSPRQRSTSSPAPAPAASAGAPKDDAGACQHCGRAGEADGDAGDGGGDSSGAQQELLKRSNEVEDLRWELANVKSELADTQVMS